MTTFRFRALVLLMLIPVGLCASEKAPDFTLAGIDGEKFDLYQRLPQGPVLMDFWATWCKPCLQALPHLEQIRAQYAERGLQVVAISIDNPRSQSKVKPFVRGMGYSFEVLLDGDMEVRRLFGGTNIPLTILIAPSGEVIYEHLGYIPGDEKTLIQEIQKLLEPAPADTSHSEPETTEEPVK